MDLLDSRIGALEEADLSNAGSNIKQALAEAVQIMREEIDLQIIPQETSLSFLMVKSMKTLEP